MKNALTVPPISTKAKIMNFVPKLLKLIEACFETLESKNMDDQSDDNSENKLSYLEAFKFLNMLYKILPRD